MGCVIKLLAILLQIKVRGLMMYQVDQLLVIVVLKARCVRGKEAYSL